MITAQQYIYNSKREKLFVTSHKHNQSSQDGKKVGKDGDVYILLSVYSEKESVPSRFSRFILDAILDGYLYSNSRSTNESVKEAVDDGVNKVKELIKNDKDLTEVGLDVNFSIVVFKKEGAYIGVFGENEVALHKNGIIVDISEMLKQKKANTVGVVLKQGDVLIVSTQGNISENRERISRVKTSEDMLKYIKLLGESLSKPSGLFAFAVGEKQMPIPVSEPLPIEKPTSLPKVTSKKYLVFVDGIKKKLISLFNLIKRIKIPRFQGGKAKVLLLKAKDILRNVQNKLAKIVSGIISFVYEKVKNKRWFKKIGSKFSTIKISSGSVRREGFRVDGYKVKDLRIRKFKLGFVVISIVVILALGVNFTVNQKKAREVSKYANERFTQISEYLDKVDKNWRVDRSGAEVYLFKVEKLFDEIPEGLKESDLAKYSDLYKRYEGLGDTIYRRVGISEESGNISKYLEARLSFGEGSAPSDIDIYTDKSGNEYLFVSDKDLNSVYRVALYDKAVRTVPDSEKVLIDPEYISVGKNGVYVFDSKLGMAKASFDKGGWFKDFAALSGLSIEDVKSNEIVEMIILTDSDNVYLLSRDLQTVLKSTPAYGDRYGLSYPYLDKEDFVEANDIFADLSVYVSTSGENSLVRYNFSYVQQKMAEAPLSVGAFDGNFGNITKGFTRDNMKKPLYLFDSEGKRILKFEKPLEGGGEILHPDQIVLLTQYVYRGGKGDVWSDVKDFVVNEKDNTAYVLDGFVIWKVAL